MSHRRSDPSDGSPWVRIWVNLLCPSSSFFNLLRAAFKVHMTSFVTPGHSWATVQRWGGVGKGLSPSLQPRSCHVFQCQMCDEDDTSQLVQNPGGDGSTRYRVPWRSSTREVENFKSYKRAFKGQYLLPLLAPQSLGYQAPLARGSYGDQLKVFSFRD